MPYARRPKTTKKRYSKKSRKTSKVPAATKKYVRRIMPKTEVKQTWSHTDEFPMNTLTQGNATNTNVGIVQSTSGVARVGNSLNALGMHIKGVFNNNSTSESYMRMVVLSNDPKYDWTTSLFRNADTGTVAGFSSVFGLNAMYYPLNKVDYTVRFDKVFKLAGSATGNSGSNTRMFSKYIKFGGKKVTFKANTTGSGNQDWTYNTLFFAADANDDTSTGTAVETSCLERFFYTDA